MRILLALLTMASAYAQAPYFVADRVLPSGGSRALKLGPGMLISIYGDHLGPMPSCTGHADPRRRETPNPARPRQSFVETLIYPVELCGVQVFLADRAAGLLYVSESQINFKMPQESPVTGEAELKVVFNRQEYAVNVPVGLETVALSLDRPARVGGPVWLRIDSPFGRSPVVYPVEIQPWDFGCQEVEVRRNGVPLPKIQIRPSAGGAVRNGLLCGFIGIPGYPATHTGRLPLHLQYRFDRPGVFEVRYRGRNVSLESEWTPIEVLPPERVPRVAGAMPDDPADAISDYLPSLLGVADDAAMDAVLRCLYHPEVTVRRYAAAALGYWPEEEVKRRLTEVYLARGPSDAVIDSAIEAQPELLARTAPYLRSADPVLLRGAVVAASRLEGKQPDAAMDRALLNAAEHILRQADPQTVVDYVSILGAVKDDRASALLWDLTAQRATAEQALIAITWRKNPADLPRLAAMLDRDESSREAASLPYALRHGYGDAALPYLEMALRNSPNVWVRTNCARELVLAGRSSGFAFIADAIIQNRGYKLEMMQFLRDQFPALRKANEPEILDFLKRR